MTTQRYVYFKPKDGYSAFCDPKNWTGNCNSPNSQPKTQKQTPMSKKLSSPKTKTFGFNSNSNSIPTLILPKSLDKNKNALDVLRLWRDGLHFETLSETSTRGASRNINDFPNKNVQLLYRNKTRMTFFRVKDHSNL